MILLPFMAELLAGCLGCDDSRTIDYSICDLSIEVVDNSGLQPEVTLNSYVSKNAFGLRLDFLLERRFCKIKPVQNLFSTPAYAMSGSCSDTPIPQIRTHIDSLTIIALRDFSPDLPAGSDISSLFYVYQPTIHLREFTSIQDFVNHRHYSTAVNNTPQESFNLLLMTPPTTEGEHQFLVKVIMADGREFEVETRVIELLP